MVRRRRNKSELMPVLESSRSVLLAASSEAVATVLSTLSRAVAAADAREVRL